MPAEGRFAWVRRMGVHEAYHQSGANRLFHWICVPLQLYAVVKLLSLVGFGRLDLALVVLVVVAPIYLATDLVGGLLMTALLVGFRLLAPVLTTGPAWADALLALALFVAAFVFQTRVGHGVFERGVDDTEQNLAELRRTRNPIPILLVFYYHLVELLFAVGYRPAVQRAMLGFREDELARIENDPRRA